MECPQYHRAPAPAHVRRSQSVTLGAYHPRPMGEPEWLRVHTADGRALEVLLAGPVEGILLLYNSGTPTAAAPWPQLQRVAAERGLRWVTYSRPGYADSTPNPGRGVDSVAADVAAILDRLGAAEFVTIGWSGGGPHALACAALLPDRCLAAATIAGVAPYPADGLDWPDGMGPENVDEFRLAVEGPDSLTPFLLEQAAQMSGVQGHQVAEALGGLASDVDKAVITGELAEYLAETFRRSVSRGIDGWLADDLAFVAPWGFDLGAITRPVAVWQGAEDRMVPFNHGAWLAQHVPTAEAHLDPAEGHISLVTTRLGAIVDDLLRLAGHAA